MKGIILAGGSGTCLYDLDNCKGIDLVYQKGKTAN